MTLYLFGEETERIDLRKYETVKEIHALMQEKGFVRKSDDEVETIRNRREQVWSNRKLVDERIQRRGELEEQREKGGATRSKGEHDRQRHMKFADLPLKRAEQRQRQEFHNQQGVRKGNVDSEYYNLEKNLEEREAPRKLYLDEMDSRRAQQSSGTKSSIDEDRDDWHIGMSVKEGRNEHMQEEMMQPDRTGSSGHGQDTRNVVDDSSHELTYGVTAAAEGTGDDTMDGARSEF